MPVIAVGLALALIMALFSPRVLAPGRPRAGRRGQGVPRRGEGPAYEIIPDYTFPGVENEKVATILSGIVGVAIVAAIGFGLVSC